MLDFYQVYIQTLVMKLQMHSLELNNSLEELSVQALSAIPKAMREVERLRKEVRWFHVNPYSSLISRRRRRR